MPEVKDGAKDGTKYEPRLKTLYDKSIREKLTKQFSYTNQLQAPRLDKVVINMGVGEAVADSKKIRSAMADLAAISGQKPMETKSRKSIANFKLRDNMVIGCKVTLRRERMWEFLDRLINIALPRIRDFRGVSSRSFDGRGNYSMGVTEQIVFPEIEYDKIDALRGMDITITTKAKTDEHCKALLEAFSFPFRK